MREVGWSVCEVPGSPLSRDWGAVHLGGNMAAHGWQLTQLLQGTSLWSLPALWHLHKMVFILCLSSSHLECFFAVYQTAEIDIFSFSCSKTRTTRLTSFTVVTCTVHWH